MTRWRERNDSGRRPEARSAAPFLAVAERREVVRVAPEPAMFVLVWPEPRFVPGRGFLAADASAPDDCGDFCLDMGGEFFDMGEFS
jgi:hypothetical protein